MKQAFKSLCILLVFSFFSATSFAAAKYHFQIVGPGGFTATALEVTGMEKEVEIIEYRQSDSALFHTEKMPGIGKYGNITINRMTVTNDANYWNFAAQVQMNTIARGTWYIKLVDESGDVITTWQLINAWPVRINGTDLKSSGNKVAIESLELAHEQLVVTNNND